MAGPTLLKVSLESFILAGHGGHIDLVTKIKFALFSYFNLYIFGIFEKKMLIPVRPQNN